MSIIPSQPLPPEVELGAMFEVILGEVKSPHKFYLQLRSQHSALTAMMDRLDVAMETRLEESRSDPELPPPEVSVLYPASLA